jgi:hypothetical protein
MDDAALLVALERLAQSLGIPVRYAELATDELPGRGGMCVLHGERRIIIERSLGDRDKARLLARGLAQFDLEGVFLLPAVRDLIDAAREGSRSGKPPAQGKSGG